MPSVVHTPQRGWVLSNLDALKPGNQIGIAKLKCMKRGEYPKTGKDWPLPIGVNAPYELRAYQVE